MKLEDIAVLVFVAIFGFVGFKFLDHMGNQAITSEGRVWSYTSKVVNPFDRKTTNYVIESRLDGWVVSFNQTNKTEKFTNTIEEFKKDKQCVGLNR